MGNLPLILAGLAILVMLLWFFRPLLGGASASSASSGDAGSGRLALWMIMQGDAGPEFVPCKRDAERHGYVVHGVFYPGEFVRQVRNGQGIYMMATHCQMPSDGDVSHTGDYDELAEVAQPNYLAAWADFDRARRRLVWSSLYERGSGSLAGLKVIGNGLLVVTLVILLITTLSMRGTVARVADANVVLTGQLANIGAGPGVSPAALPASGDVGRPTGDK